MIKINKNPEYFLTVAAEKSISKAAEKLYISQPYLSQHIIRLEESFNIKLLDREKTPLSLTPAGEIYAQYLESSQQLYNKLIRDFDDLNTNRTQILRIGFSNWRASILLPDILPLFSEAYPNVKLEFFEVRTNELFHLIADDKVDFVIMNTSLDIPDSLIAETILYEKILLVGNRKNAVTKEFLQSYAANEPLNLHLLEKERMILLRPNLLLAKRINNYLSKQQILLQNFIHTTNTTTALNLVTQNYGFCFLNETGIDCTPASQDLAFFDLNSDDMIHPLCVIYKKKSYLTPIARSFIDLTISFYKTLRTNNHLISQI